MEQTQYDVIIIGSGAGGGTLAHKLASTGKKILLIERGDYLPREKQNWSGEAVFVENRYQTPDPWTDKDGKVFYPGVHYYVGGSTKMFGAAMFRLREADFSEIKHYGGISPAWPIRYEELEPYYTEAEQLYHIHGKHGVDPTDPPASRDYGYPPVSHEPRIQELYDDMQAAGLHPFPLPLGVLMDEKNGKIHHTSQCIRCNAFDGFPCMVNGKADAQVICVDPTLKQFSNVTLLTNAYAETLETDSTGKKITGVNVLYEGQKLTFKADIVVVSCGAINSAALLLRSANDKHPRGLANGSDMVGRNYLRHNSSAFMAVSLIPNPTVFQKTLGVNDFYYGADDSEFPLGNIQMLGKSDGAMLKADAPLWAKWFPEMGFEELTKFSVDFWLTSEDLPDPNNRVTLDKNGKIVLSLTPNNMEAHHRLIAKLESYLDKLKLHKKLFHRPCFLEKYIGVGGTAHQAGTLRFGRDPSTSVLDIHCKAHELDNLYVVDTSFFVSIGAVNPSLTAVANALRVGDHLKQRL